MALFDRRDFLANSLSTLAGASLAPGWMANRGLAQSKEVPSGNDQGSSDTLFLTWQGDPTTTMTIQWVAEETTDDIAVRFGPLRASELTRAATQIKPYPGTGLKVFRCELTGLEPGAEYKFQIGESYSSYRFRTMPAKASDEFRFVSGGDSGIGEHALATNRLAALQNPNFVLIGGDLAYDNGKSPDTFAQFLRNYHATMYDSSHRMIPMISCLGNHDVVGGYAARREGSPQFLSVFDGLFSERTFNTLDFGDYLSLVLLDTNHIAPVAGEQTSWLAKTLADRQEMPHLLVANHIPAYPSYRSPEGIGDGKGTGEDQREHWSPLFERYKVDAVLEHHDHTFKRTHPLTDGLVDRNGVVYLGDGSWGKLRVPKTPEERPYLAKVAEAYHMTVHSLQGESRIHLAMEDSGRIADIYASHQKRVSRKS